MWMKMVVCGLVWLSGGLVSNGSGLSVHGCVWTVPPRALRAACLCPLWAQG